MNLRLILFSASMTALVGAGIGFGISKIERNPSQVLYRNHYIYQSLYARYFTVSGAIAGFLIGGGLQTIKELKEERDREMGIE
ncbi:hypothetical protein V0288_00420 [Pannus brasiliensis CCIBt3594]|uniref:Uncharacterized protein n=1 Tax=Pannus brasiliensis CCIBt3594 TaxID=1427578 RepID=A0AAW9QCX0_9CHRO